MAQLGKVYMCDFETTVGEKTNVWLWGAYELGAGIFNWGRNIESFLEFVHQEKCTVYFHNLKFDGMFLLDYYLKHGVDWIPQLSKLKDNTIKTVISDKGQFYKFDVHWMGCKVQYRDSLKIIPLPVEKIPKAFGLSLRKLEMKYEDHKYGEPNDPDDDDIDYLRNDCVIVGEALEIMLGRGMNKLTTGANALSWYKQRQEEFDSFFPQLTPDEDKDIRRCYKGAWCYVNPKYQKQMVGAGRVYDVNSMYAWAMRYNPMPVGKPIKFTKQDLSGPYPLWVAAIKMDLVLKPGKYPCVQLKNNPRYIETEYLEKTDGPTWIYVTNIDYALIHDCYTVLSEAWFGGYKFLSHDGVFTEYIDYWYHQKELHSRDGNEGFRFIDKQMLVNLYGKFGTNPIKDIKMPYIENDIVRFKRVEMPKSYDGYVPIAAFITSYCRDKIIRDANRAGDRFLYADTDSLHVLGDEPLGIDTDSYRLGAYKHESTFTQAMYFRPKMYIETIAGELHKTVAGLPKAAREVFDYSSMRTGAEFEGKLMPKIVPGGVVLTPHTFKIRG